MVVGVCVRAFVCVYLCAYVCVCVCVHVSFFQTSFLCRFVGFLFFDSTAVVNVHIPLCVFHLGS